MAAERLQKLMAAAGIGSRRHCETLISEGRVQVNGKTVTELGAKADPARDRIAVDGKPLAFQTQHVYYKVHKPRGVISDIGGDEVDLRTGELRRTVEELLPEGHSRVFPVGRLDLHSEGLVLLTDDGELANRLTHPRYQHPKTYYVLLAEQPSQEALVRLRNGVDLPEGRSAPAEVMIVSYLPATLRLSKGPTEGVWLRVVLREGKKRQIRHMTAAVGYPTLRLLRWAIGPLTLGDLELGQARTLTVDEINALRKLAGLATIKQPRSERSGSERSGSERSGSERSSERSSAGRKESGAKAPSRGAGGGRKPAVRFTAGKTAASRRAGEGQGPPAGKSARPAGTGRGMRLVAGSKTTTSSAGSSRSRKAQSAGAPPESEGRANAGRTSPAPRSSTGSRGGPSRPPAKRQGAPKPPSSRGGRKSSGPGNKPAKKEPRRD